jgi:DNA-directed RNA polymerase subunit RPC12/RpoP
MSIMGKAPPNTATRISSFVLMIIFIVLALSLTALILATTAFGQGNEVVAGYLLLMGFLGVALSTYVLFQTRRRILRLRIETPQITTTIECKKCGFKSVREFQRGDYVFKEVEPCQKCSDKMLITAIFREVKEKERAPS